jgi:hypothetical protein
MSKYSAPKNKKTKTFNLNDFQFQDSFITYNNALNLSNNQVISGEKTFSTDLVIDSTTTGSLTINDNKIQSHSNAFEITTDDGYHLNVNSNKKSGGDLIVNSNSKYSNMTVENGNLNVKTGNVIIGKGALILNGANIQAVVNNNTYQLSIHADSISTNTSTLVEHSSNIQTVTDVAVENTNQIVGIQNSYAPLDQPVFTTNLTLPSNIISNSTNVSDVQVSYLSNLNEDLNLSLTSIQNDILSIQTTQLYDESNISNLQTSVNAINLQLVADESNISAINSKLIVDENNILNSQNSIGLINAKLVTNDSNISLINSKLNTDESNILTNTNNISTINSKLVVNDSNINNIQSNLSIINTKLITNDANINTINSKLTTDESNILTNHNDILTNTSNISSINTKLISDEANILSNTNDINTINTNILTLAPINSPIFTGNPCAPTQVYNDNSNKLATTAFVSTQINNLINSAAPTMDTLGEIAAILQADTNSIGTLISAMNTKSNIDNATFTGNTSINNLDVSGVVSGSGFINLLNPYVLSTALTTTLNSYALISSLSSYVQSSALTTTLNAYVQSTALTTTLNSYALISSLSSYVQSSALTTTLNSYALISSLSSYVQSSALTTTLNAYVSNSALTTTLGSYLTSTTASTTYQTIANTNNILNGTTSFTGFKNTGQSYCNRIAEQITSLTGSASVSANYTSGAIFYIASPHTANFQILLTNVPITNTYTTYTFSLILNSQTNKTYCNSLSVNGTAITIYYNNGSANISLTSSILTLQTFNVIFLGIATTPSYIFCSVVPIY